MPRSTPPRNSPLWLVTREPLVDELVGYLEQRRLAILGAPTHAHTLTFSLRNLDAVRSAFARTIRAGEARLHDLCALLAANFSPDGWELESIVVGEVDTTRERFTLSQPLTAAELTAQTDLDLGSRQVSRLRFWDGGAWSGATLVSNVVAYQPRATNALDVHRLVSRIKAEEELWNKVTDEIFDVDALVRRDKQLRHLSRFVKDVFGIKILVGSVEAARTLQTHLEALAFSPDDLQPLRLDHDPDARRIEWIETKNYLDRATRKNSGWEAIKSVVRWRGTMFEIQIQTLADWHLEREALTRQSHRSFKARRDELREELARAIPLYGHYRDLLRWLFVNPDGPPPRFEGIELVIVP